MPQFKLLEPSTMKPLKLKLSLFFLGDFVNSIVRLTEVAFVRMTGNGQENRLFCQSRVKLDLK